MIPIKIRCDCGQKYAFDVEPINGLMTYAVQCPVCGVDGTASANRLIAERLGPQMPFAPGLRIGKANSVLREEPPTTRSLPIRPAASRSPDRNRGKNWLWAAVAGAALSICVGAVFLARGVGLNQKSAHSEPKQNDGFPHTLAELNAWYAEPPLGQNAATYDLEGMKLLGLDNIESSGLPLLGKGKLPPLGSPMPASMRTALSRVIGSNRDALQSFAKGAKLEQSRYPVDFNLGVEALFPHLTRIRQASQMLQLAAVLHAEAKDTKSSADDLYSALALANSLRAEPYLFSQLTRGRLAAIATAGLEQSLNRCRWTSEDLGQIANFLNKMEESDSAGEGFTRGVAGDRVTYMVLLENPGKFLQLLPGLSLDIPAEQRARIAERLQSRNLRADQQFYEQAMMKLIEARRQSFPGRLNADELMRQQVADAETKQLVVAHFLLSGLRTEATKEAECLASWRLGLTVLALERFRAGHNNRYPASLSELAPGILPTPPLDPYDGQPLRYKTKNDGYLLYSIGPDLKDNSGQRMDAGQGDLVFTIVTPPKSSQ